MLAPTYRPVEAHSTRLEPAVHLLGPARCGSGGGLMNKMIMSAVRLASIAAVGS